MPNGGAGHYVRCARLGQWALRLWADAVRTAVSCRLRLQIQLVFPRLPAWAQEKVVELLTPAFKTTSIIDPWKP